MLQVLPTNLSNLIAAGEVVSRPASVVKELLENAIDAGAKNISVIILDAGRTLIQVIDDGCGMSPEEAVLCFERHATSKIASAEDLEKIMTFGFRGEALASIAAVGEITLKTRREEDEIGFMVETADSQVISTQAVATPIGSNFAIRNLFYNLPARRKFLKSDNSELRHIISEFTKIAITHHDISLKLTSNGRDIYNLKGESNSKQRIQSIFGREITRDLVEISTDTSILKIRGFIGRPEDARKTLGNQYLFINGRYFRSPYMHKAICRPYENLIPSGYTPVYYIFLETAYDRVDVNIHPAKTEVKFEDETMVFEILTAAVREALGKNSFMPSIDFDTEGAPDIPHAGRSFDYSHTAPPKIDYDPLFNPFNDNSFLSSFESIGDETPSVDRNPGYGKLFEEQQTRTNLIIVRNKYIITPVKSGMMVINILRARERVFFERYMASVMEEQPLCQQMVFPQHIELQREDYLTLTDNLDTIAKLGFDIRDMGGNSVVVYGVPEGFALEKESVEVSVDSMIASFKEEDPLTDNKTKYAKSLAKSAAVGQRKGPRADEAQMLVDQLFACSEPSTTPDGNRCMAIITIEEIDKKL